MSRGYKPVVAIGEAQRKAITWGFLLIGLVTEAKLPFDFMIRDNDRTSLVRVRRLKYATYRPENILITCAQEIKELREFKIPDGILKELWVRGSDRSWHRYLILAENIEVLKEGEDSQEDNGAADIPHLRQKPVEK
jgi:hypothetical protein